MALYRGRLCIPDLLWTHVAQVALPLTVILNLPSASLPRSCPGSLVPSLLGSWTWSFRLMAREWQPGCTPHPHPHPQHQGSPRWGKITATGGTRGVQHSTVMGRPLQTSERATPTPMSLSLKVICIKITFSWQMVTHRLGSYQSHKDRKDFDNRSDLSLGKEVPSETEKRGLDTSPSW